jgi:hypothetical protein
VKRYSEDAWEQAMKVQDVILRAMAKRSTRLVLLCYVLSVPNRTTANGTALLNIV